MRTHSRKLFPVTTGLHCGLATFDRGSCRAHRLCRGGPRSGGRVRRRAAAAAYVETIQRRLVPATSGWGGYQLGWPAMSGIADTGPFRHPAPRAWNAGYWHRDHRGHYWVPGHWR